jgi:RNA-binding protein
VLPSAAVELLTGKQRRFLRGLGHNLSPVVQLGKDGLDDGVVRAVDAALTQHELIKVKLGSETPEDRHDVASELSERTESAVAQVLGRTILLYRKHPKEPRIVLPKG